MSFQPAVPTVPTAEEALERMIRSYERYYNINRETPMPPFAAEAVFSAHNEQYFLIKSAKWAEMDSHEFVFFAQEDTLTEEKAQKLADLAWQEGLRRADPKPNHRNTDTVLIVVCRSMEPAAAALIKKTNPSQSYRFGLWGWSNFKWIAYATCDGMTVTNRHGQSLRDLVCNIEKKRKGENT